MTRRKAVELIRKGKYAAEVEIDLHYSEESWSPTMSLDDARKLETVMLALRRGDVAETSKHGRVFELTPSQPSNDEGESVAAGPPEAMVKEKRSYTGA